MLQIIGIVPISTDGVVSALKSDFKDEEDAMQNFTAIENSKITTIISRNVKDYKHSTLDVLTPKQYIAQKSI